LAATAHPGGVVYLWRISDSTGTILDPAFDLGECTALAFLGDTQLVAGYEHGHLLFWLVEPVDLP
jgi:hypothetical protein